MKKIIAFGAHPDDVEFGCSAVLIKEIKAGNEVKIIVGSLGEAGTNGTPEGRKIEAQKAAEYIGAQVEFIDLGGDCHIKETPENIIKIAGIIREFKPNIVLAPSQSENQHPDHLAVSHMAQVACRYARYGGLEEVKNFPPHSVDALYYYPSSAELDKIPDIIMDVSEEYDTWMKAMAFHESQMKTVGYMNLITSKARALGASMGVEYAVGFWVNDPTRVEKISDINKTPRSY